MKRHLITAMLYTLVTTLLLGFIYPLAVTMAAKALFRQMADGQIITDNGTQVGSRIIAQPFSRDRYFHSRLSAAGTNGYDSTNSGGTNYGPTNKKLIDRVHASVVAAGTENPHSPVPVDMVTASASGLDPDITPANAEFQAPRVALARHMTLDEVRSAIRENTSPRQFGFLGEPRVNVLELNLALDRLQH
ncbi:MAG: potassium-transporting ATPase subunit KdpC [Acidobacteriaceae bacterium]